MSEAEELEKQRRLLKREREEFSRNKEIERKWVESQKLLFDMKWKMLEDEWRKLAMEKERLSRKKQFYAHIEEYDSRRNENEICVSDFFSGVKSASSLRKRYRELIKIFHPDNLSGDTVVIQKINREYEELKKRMAG